MTGRTSTSSRSGSRTPARCMRRCWTRASSRGCRSRRGIPDDPGLADALLLAATELTTDEDIDRLVTALVGRAAVPA
ncbi:MAG: hypothetical protein R3C32_09010 [Chloroflexota bacterium]